MRFLKHWQLWTCHHSFVTDGNPNLFDPLVNRSESSDFGKVSLIIFPSSIFHTWLDHCNLRWRISGGILRELSRPITTPDRFIFRQRTLKPHIKFTLVRRMIGFILVGECASLGITNYPLLLGGKRTESSQLEHHGKVDLSCDRCVPSGAIPKPICHPQITSSAPKEHEKEITFTYTWHIIKQFGSTFGIFLLWVCINSPLFDRGYGFVISNKPLDKAI